MTEDPESSITSSPHRTPGVIALPVRDLAQVIVVIILWSICYPLITTGLTASPPFHLAAIRSLLAGASLLLAGIVCKRPLIPGRDVWFFLIIISLTFTTLGFTGMFLAGERVTPGLATVIANAQPLLAALLGYFVLTERLTRARGLALMAGFAGIIVITIPGLLEPSANSTPAGIGLVLVGATGVAIGNVLLKRIANRVDPLIGMAWILLLGAIPLIAAAATYEQTILIDWNISSVVNIVVLSVLGTGLAFVLWLDLLRRAELNLLNTYTFLAPVFALAIGSSFYDEQLSAIEWVGVSLVVLAVLLASRTSTRHRHKPPMKVSTSTPDRMK